MYQQLPLRRPFPCLVLFCLLPAAGCGSSAPAPPPAAPQAIRFDGVYRAFEDRGMSDSGEKIYKLICLRFLDNGAAHVAISHGIFDVDEKTRNVAGEGLLSDALLNSQGSRGLWILNGNQLKITFHWQARGRWKNQDGAKSFEFDNAAELIDFMETHSGVVDGNLLTMHFDDPAFQSSGEYQATFVPTAFSPEPEPK